MTFISSSLNVMQVVFEVTIMILLVHAFCTAQWTIMDDGNHRVYFGFFNIYNSSADESVEIRHRRSYEVSWLLP